MLLLSGFRGSHDSFVFLKSIFYLAIAQSSVKAFTLVYLKFMSILAQEPIFSILHIHFSKTSTLDYLFYTLFYLNNHFLTFYIISLSYPFNIFEHTRTHSLSLYLLQTHAKISSLSNRASISTTRIETCSS